MRVFIYLVWTLLAGCLLAPLLRSQTELIGAHYFPADMEFKELRAIKTEQNLSGADPLSDVPEGALINEVGFRHYGRRTYTTDPPGTLDLEITTLEDHKAAYSLFTLLRISAGHTGPPGDVFSVAGSDLIFAQANVLVRIKSDQPEDLIMRIARSVSNRIGRHEREPLLLSHFPKPGYDSSSLRYYLGPLSVARYARTLAGRDLKFQDEVEIGQARYSLENQTGILSLVSFPTSQLADEYFNRLHIVAAASGKEPGQRLYLKGAGPILGILEGSFDPLTADRLLNSIEFAYSIKWIFDKNSRGSGGIWGTSGGILGTVVRSLVFTGFLGAISLLAGILVAAFRLLLRGYAPNNFLDRPERTEVIRLKINEN